MNFPTIQLNEAAALKANTGGGMFFDGNTAQTVKIARAEFIVSPNTGTTGMAFDVFNNENQKGYFTLWFMKPNGEYIEGFYNTLQSVMASCGVTTITPTNATINKYDQTAGKAIPTQMVVAHELMNKIFTGLFIDQYEIYNNEKRRRTELFAAFNQKGQTLQEQRDQASPTQINIQKERMLVYSAKSEAEADRKLSDSAGSHQPNVPAQGGVSYAKTPAPLGVGQPNQPPQGYQDNNVQHSGQQFAPQNQGAPINGGGVPSKSDDIPF